MNVYLKNIIRFVVLILVQVFILNNVQLGGYINPYLYVMFILLLPFETPGWLLLGLAFLLGFTVDVFSTTMGMHTAACVFMAYFRPLVLRSVASRQDYEPGIEPGIKDLGFQWFFSYSLFLVFIHHLIFFFLESFRFSEFFPTLLRVLLSVAFSMLLIIVTEYLFKKKK